VPRRDDQPNTGRSPSDFPHQAGHHLLARNTRFQLSSSCAGAWLSRETAPRRLAPQQPKHQLRLFAPHSTAPAAPRSPRPAVHYQAESSTSAAYLACLASLVAVIVVQTVSKEIGSDLAWVTSRVRYSKSLLSIYENGLSVKVIVSAVPPSTPQPGLLHRICVCVAPTTPGRVAGLFGPQGHESTSHLFAHRRRMMSCSIIDDRRSPRVGVPIKLPVLKDHGQLGNARTGTRALGSEPQRRLRAVRQASTRASPRGWGRRRGWPRRRNST
jgi:hypothetical protein